MNGAEVWLPVVGYEGLYSVSSHGRVRSEDMLVVRASGSYTKPAAIRRPGAGAKSKYLSLVLTKDRRASTHYVHRLVLAAFVGPKPPGHEACHCDGDRQNNAVWNLRWDTRAGNHADKARHGTSTAGERHPGAKLSNEAVLAMRQRRADGASVASLAVEFGVSRMTAHRAATKRSWSHL